MFRRKHGHFVRIQLLGVVTYDWFHWLLVVFSSVIAIDVITLDVDYTWALTQFSTNLQTLLNLIFVEAWSPVLRLHLRQASPLCPWF